MTEAKDTITGVVYVKITQRNVIPSGVEGPIGDTVIASGLLYRTPNTSSRSIGRYDFNSLTTSMDNVEERRQVSAELSFDQSFVQHSWIAKLKSSSQKTKQAAEVNVTGVATFPLGGGVPIQPVTFGVVAGTGALIGAVGTATSYPVQGSGLFAWSFSLAQNVA